MMAAFPQWQVFIVLMKQWNPVLMAGVGDASLLYLRLHWTDLHYEVR